MKKTILLISILLSIGMMIQSCSSSDDITYPDNTVTFSASQLGIDESESSKVFTVSINRAISVASTIELTVTSSGLVYGGDYTTTPAASDNKVTLTIAAGETSASVTVNKLSQYFNGDESIEFAISSASAGSEELVVASGTKLSLSFSAIVSEGGELKLNGGEGASSAVNSVFVDLSANEQTSVARTSWSLGFYCGDGFAVKLNNTTASAAIQSDLALSDIISTEDSTAYAAQLLIGRGSGSFDIIDDLDGDLTKNIIKAGDVYLVRLGETATGESGLYKVKVDETADGYSLQYAASGSADVNTVEIGKNSEYNFMYYSFGSDALVDVEPLKTKWDFRWSYQTYTAGTIPYNFADFIVINYLGGTTVAQVMTEDITYDNFSASNAANIEFSSDINAIGGNWRVTTGNGIYTDRFYVIKDSSNNIYKLRFLKMGVGSDGGTRGYPELEYALVQ